jgi:hypothetical protein
MRHERILDELRERNGCVDRGVLGAADQRRRQVDVELLLGLRWRIDTRMLAR